MEAVIHLDTHVLVWLFAGEFDLLSAAAAAALEDADELRCSPMARLELQYLYEVGRAALPAAEVFDALTATLGLRVSDAPFLAVTREAERQVWTHDPFDRLIVAGAIADGAPLLTKDAAIHSAWEGALW